MASMVAVGGERSGENRVRRVAAGGFGYGKALRGRQRRRGGDDRSRSFFSSFHTSRKPPRPFSVPAQPTKWPAQAYPLSPLGDVYVSKEPSRPQPTETGRRSLTLSRGCSRPSVSFPPPTLAVRLRCAALPGRRPPRAQLGVRRRPASVTWRAQRLSG